METFESIETCASRSEIGTAANIANSISNIQGAHDAYGFILPVSGDVIARSKEGQ